MRAPLAVLALTLAALAGCLATPAPEPGSPADPVDFAAALSQPRFDILPPEEVWVPSSVDGKGLHNALYRPDTDEAVPVWVNFSPYWGDTALAEGDAFAHYLIHEYVPRGYAVVLSAVRGTGHSEGCFQLAGDLEVQDAWDVVDHFARQPWSNGHVGAGGKSYDSTTQNGLLAKLPHPALKTTFHVSGITDFYRYNYRSGVPYTQGSSFNTLYGLGQGLDEYGLSPFFFASDLSGLQDDDPESLARAADDAACPELAEMTVSGYGSGATGMYDAYYIERDWNRYIAGSATGTSVFFVHGLQDWNVKPDHILPWLQQLPASVAVKGWLHQWDRDPQGGHVYPMRADWNATMLRWMDHWLKGIDTGILEEPAFEVQGSDGTWRAMPAWPPAVEPTEVRLEPLAGTQRGLDLLLAEATEAPLGIAGVMTLDLTAASAGPDPVLTAVLYDEAPDGERTWVNQAVLRGTLRGGLDGPPAPVVANEPFAATLEFYPMDAVLEPGHRWVLALGGDPRFVAVSPAQASGITYDLASGVATVPFAGLDGALTAQPEPIDCFAC